MSNYPSLAELRPRSPYSFTLRDDYQVVQTPSKHPDSGDVLSVEVQENLRGKPRLVAVAGYFHTRRRQNDINSLLRLESMVRVSEREEQLIRFHCPFPRVSIRGYIRNLRGPRWASKDGKKRFAFSFDVERSDKPRQPNVFGDPADIPIKEGNAYVLGKVDSDHTNLEDFMHAYRQRTNNDFRHIQETLALELMSPSEARFMDVDRMLRVPRR